MSLGPCVNTKSEILVILEEVLSLNGRSENFTPDTPLLGAIPELDSMAVISLLTRLEEHFGFTLHDDEIDGAAFATLGALVSFVESKCAT